MGVADRVRKRQIARHREQTEGVSQNGSPVQSSLVLAEPAHIARLRGVMSSLMRFVQENNDGSMMGRMAPILMSFAEELADELGELDELAIRAYMYQIGEVISWIGHGDNERLPEGVRAFAEMIQPTGDEVGTVEGDSETDEPAEGDAVVAGMDDTSGMQEIRS